MANQGILDGRLPKQHGKVNTFGKVMFGFSAVSNIHSRISNGDGLIGATVKGATSAFIEDGVSNLLGKAALPYMFVQGGLALADAKIEAGKHDVSKAMDAVNGMATMTGKDAIHTKNATSMRNRGMSMINEHGETVRSTFGSEARAYFKSSY